eukprot:CAMPEP_0116874648 /NCGR_PEP_ID=MMETSP0463-20121206/6158_1 /TAXON_ID=181622 /ORGANISM="Strombidinopsis sp, Strain SopsisLIS2011" /LENGTH=128 /DNA_ID=CAMNT_0004518599 /DNA_START=245 /DNA_END=632 /DNA_ORIENTATION=+
MSFEIGSEGLKIMKEDYEISKMGMRSISTGAVIAGNLSEDDIELGEVIGTELVYRGIHKPTGRPIALKSINVHDKGKRHQMINDLRSLSNHDCPFLIKFYGALYEEGSVKVALELMDMGSLKSVLSLA